MYLNKTTYTISFMYTPVTTLPLSPPLSMHLLQPSLKASLNYLDLRAIFRHLELCTYRL